MKTLVPLTIDTLRRKINRSLAQRGMIRTVNRGIARTWEALRSVARSLLPCEQRYRSAEREFDRRHHVATRVEWDPGWMAKIANPNWRYGIGYAPVPAEDAASIIAGLAIPYQEFAFIDLGAGKGRALFVASQFPFRQIVGVEYSPALAETMQTNIASYRNPAQRCFELKGLLQDATQYDFPPCPLVVFFHHPFGTVVLRQVRERIESSLAEHPRKILVIYYDPQCRAVFDESAHFRLLQRGLSNGQSAASGDWIVYESRDCDSPSIAPSDERIAR